MSMIPGNTLEKAIFNDGLQSDHLSENTVGHGVSIQGRTSGVAIDSGYVGEVISGSTIAGTTVLTTSYATISTIALTKGVWLTYYQADIEYVTGSTLGDRGYIVVRIADSSGTTQIGASGKVMRSQKNPVAAATSPSEGCVSAIEILNISSDTNYILQAKRTDDQGTATSASLYNTGPEGTVFKAIRIA